MTNIRVGIIGLGHAARHHASAISQTIGMELSLVAGRSMERAEEFCKLNGGAARVATVSEVISSPDIDAIFIAIPGAEQAKLAVASFNAGKHVLCEKPLATTLEDAVLIEEAWVRSGRVGMVNFCYRLIPEVSEFKRLLASGICGEINLVQVDWVLASRIKSGLTPNWKAYSETGGGVLNNYGVHILDYLFHDQHNVEVVGARTGALFPTRLDERGKIRHVSGEEWAVVFFDIGYPVIVNLSLVTSPSIGHRVIAYGNKGTLELTNLATTSPGGPFFVTWFEEGVVPKSIVSDVKNVNNQHDLATLFTRISTLFSKAIHGKSTNYSPSISDGVKAAKLLLQSKEHAK